MKYNFLNQLFDEEDEFEDLFDEFDFNLLDSPDFKEDAVREEIVFPILKKLGYSASSENKIIRSKNLKHPFCYFGTKKHSVNIVPDYTFEIDGENKWILDAKRPTEDIRSGKNVAQAYSYAVHQEIRSEIYCLCNGKEITVFDVKHNKPVLDIHIKDLKENWNELEKFLSPEFVKKPFLKNFKLDFGLFIAKTATDEIYYTPIPFPFDTLNFIAKLKENKYTINGQFKFNYEGYENLEFAASFDFEEKQYQELLAILPDKLKSKIKSSLSNQPFRYMDENSEKFHFEIHATLGGKIHTNDNESYMPLIVSHFEKKNCSQHRIKTIGQLQQNRMVRAHL